MIRVIRKMTKFSYLLIGGLISCLGWNAMAAIDCKKVRFSDVGWTDITASTALAATLLDLLGYQTKTAQLSVPVTYVSLKNHDLDVFLGNWMPSMAADIRPYQIEGSVETVSELLKGARYTLAVPDYVHEAGIDSVAQLAQNKEKFQGRIYGIEPGNDGNRLIQKIISENAFGLGGWKLVESSEQAMLMEVFQAVKRKKWIAFLGWEPHPMNTKIKIIYLKGADGYFGPNQGESTVFINTRKNYSVECPDVTRFLKNFSLTIDIENTLMKMILEQKMDPKVAAKKWVGENPQQVRRWLNGVRSLDGQEAFKVVSKKLGLASAQ